ncbi:MAG: leucine-rich repeat protein [Bacillota bacterium]
MKKITKSIILILMLAFMVMLCVGCSGESTTEEDAVTDSGDLGSEEELINEILALIDGKEIESISYDDFLLTIAFDDGTELSCSMQNPDPYVGENGNWWIGNNDLGIKVEAQKIVTVEFNAFYNLTSETQEVVAGECLELPIPVQEGYEFLGWFTGSSANDKQFTSYDPIFEDMKLYAKWQEITEYYYTDGLNFSFSEQTNTYSVEFENSVYSDYRETITEIVIPSSYDDGENGRYPVTTIATYAFQYFTNLETIVLPDTITYIGQWAFSYCEKLESITLPDNAMVVSFDAFNNCTSLKEIIISENNQYYISKDGVIYSQNATSLMFVPPALGIVDFVIPEDITYLKSNSFADNVTLKSITFNDKITAIDYGTFEGCMKLETVNNLDNIISIGNSAFFECFALESIELSENLTTIGQHAFCKCTSLEEITLPSNITVLEDGVFSNCTSLTIVNGMDSVTSIGEGAFSSCKNLKEIILSENISSIGFRAFWNCESLTSIIIPKNVTFVGDGAFQYCCNMQEINYEGKEADITFGEDIYFGCDAKINFEYVAQ